MCTTKPSSPGLCSQVTLFYSQLDSRQYSSNQSFSNNSTIKGEKRVLVDWSGVTSSFCASLCRISSCSGFLAVIFQFLFSFPSWFRCVCVCFQTDPAFYSFYFLYVYRDNYSIISYDDDDDR